MSSVQSIILEFYVGMVTPVTDWRSDLQTENTSNVNVFWHGHIFLFHKESSMTVILKQTKKRHAVSEWVSEGQTRS